eukprot:6366516-Pyramimonas_sp.AAC.1
MGGPCRCSQNPPEAVSSGSAPNRSPWAPCERSPSPAKVAAASVARAGRPPRLRTAANRHLTIVCVQRQQALAAQCKGSGCYTFYLQWG